MELLILSVLTYTVISAAPINSPEWLTGRKWCGIPTHTHKKDLPGNVRLASHPDVTRFRKGTLPKRKPQLMEYPAYEGMPRAKSFMRKDIPYESEAISVTEPVGIDLELGGTDVAERLKRMAEESEDNPLEWKLKFTEKLETNKDSIDHNFITDSPLVSSAVMPDVPTAVFLDLPTDHKVAPPYVELTDHKVASPYVELEALTEMPEHEIESVSYKMASPLARSVALESGSKTDRGTMPESERADLTIQERMSQMLTEIEKSEQEIKEGKSVLSSLIGELSGSTNTRSDKLTTRSTEAEVSHSSENVNSSLTSSVTPLAVRAEHTLLTNDSPVLFSTSKYYENVSKHKPDIVLSPVPVTDQSDADVGVTLRNIQLSESKIEIRKGELVDSVDVSSQASPHVSEIVSEATSSSEIDRDALSSSFKPFKKFAGSIKTNAFSEDPIEDVVTGTVLPMGEVMKMLQNGAVSRGDPKLNNNTLVVGTEEVENTSSPVGKSLLLDGKTENILDIDYNKKTVWDQFSDRDLENYTVVAEGATEISEDNSKVTFNISKVLVEDRVQDATTDKTVSKANPLTTTVKTTFDMSLYDSSEGSPLLEMSTVKNLPKTWYPKFDAMITERTHKFKTHGSPLLGDGEPEHQETRPDHFEKKPSGLDGRMEEQGLHGAERTEQTTEVISTSTMEDIISPEDRKYSEYGSSDFFQLPGLSEKLLEFIESEQFSNMSGNLPLVEDYDETREADIDSVPKKPIPKFLRFLAGREISSRKGTIGMSTEDSVYRNEESGYVNLTSDFKRRRPLGETNSDKERDSHSRDLGPIKVAPADIYNPSASRLPSSSSTATTLQSSDPGSVSILAKVKGLMENSSVQIDAQQPPSVNEVTTVAEIPSTSQPLLVNEVTTIATSPALLPSRVPGNTTVTAPLESSSLAPTSITLTDVAIPHPVSSDDQAVAAAASTLGTDQPLPIAVSTFGTDKPLPIVALTLETDKPLPAIEPETLSSTLLTEHLTDQATLVSNIAVSLTSNTPVPLTNYPTPMTDFPVVTTESTTFLSNPRISSALKDQTSIDESAGSTMETTTLNYNNSTVATVLLLSMTEITFSPLETTISLDNSSLYETDSSTSVTDTIAFQDTSSDDSTLVSELSTVTDEDNSTLVMLFDSQTTVGAGNPKGVPVVGIEKKGPKVKKVPTKRHDHSVVAVMSAVGCMGLLVVLVGITGVRKAIRKQKKARLLIRPRFFHRF